MNPVGRGQAPSSVRWLLLLVFLAVPVTVLASAPDAGGAARKPARTLDQVKLLYFHATWCPSCRKLDEGKVLERLQATVPGLVVEKVDVDTNEPLMSRYGVQYTPTLVLVDTDGFPLGRPTIDVNDPDGTLARLEKLVRKMVRL